MVLTMHDKQSLVLYKEGYQLFICRQFCCEYLLGTSILKTDFNSLTQEDLDYILGK